MGDRREFPRLAVSLDARYSIRGSDGRRPATVANLSANGVAMFAEEPLDPGTRLDALEFTIGDGSAARSIGPGAKVVRCQPNSTGGREGGFLVGAEFFGIDPGDRELIDRYVRSAGQPAPTPSPRIELEKPVAIRFERFDEFVTEVSRNLSATGMFIATDQPPEAGTRFELILQLGADFSLVQGRAEVVWRRLESEGPDLPAGMGIRFLELDAASENVLRRLVRERSSASLPRQELRPGPEPPAAPPPGGRSARDPASE